MIMYLILWISEDVSINLGIATIRGKLRFLFLFALAVVVVAEYLVEIAHANF